MTVDIHTTRRGVMIAGALVLALVSAACSASDETEGDATAAANVATAAAIQGTDPDTGISASGAAILTDEEVDGLLWMREEEKLAHDVYVTLFDRWHLTVFDNISRAETTHTEVVKALLDRYGIDDPAAAAAAVGEFTNPAIEELYGDLIAQGSESLMAALEVGAYIEEMDILDLQARATDVADIAAVYDNLERGSRNHLRAFVKNLERRGVTYTPSLMSVDAFDQIISTPTERGQGDRASVHDYAGPRGGGGFRGGRSNS